MGDLPGCGGAAAAELNDLTSSVGSIPLENWAAADKAGREIIRRVQPTWVSEERRKAVVQYIQRLIKTCLGAEVKNSYLLFICLFFNGLLPLICLYVCTFISICFCQWFEQFWILR